MGHKEQMHRRQGHQLQAAPAGQEKVMKGLELGCKPVCVSSSCIHKCLLCSDMPAPKRRHQENESWIQCNYGFCTESVAPPDEIHTGRCEVHKSTRACIYVYDKDETMCHRETDDLKHLYCDHHTCSYGDCRNKRELPSERCSDHSPSCVCGGAVVPDTHTCGDGTHECEIPECKKPRSYLDSLGGELCKTHEVCMLPPALCTMSESWNHDVAQLVDGSYVDARNAQSVRRSVHQPRCFRWLCTWESC